ncbi:uncharacterized protein LOC129786269 isoform X2 [Lutzomyia longipalpis]|uniref:uncharacterized protein LOC129786269 isoform X2 n=1 Tax=Lutzomyia longipalpis TaxID=7200 RepID=UPI002484476B|nr:uncharacterized protein LOC129786269 isoform X2 [Lutzomyia longipalpis]
MCLKECTVAFVVCCLLSAVSATPLPRHQSDTPITNKMTWTCVNNATCIDGVAKDIVGRLNRKESIDFGVVKVVPRERRVVAEGRSSNIMNFLSGNELRIPVGPMVFSIQRSEDYSDYFEVSLMRKGVDEEGRHKHHHHRRMRLFIPSFLAFNAVGWMLLAVTSVALLTFKAFALSKIAFLVAAAMTMRRVMGHQNMDGGHPEYLPYNGLEIDSPLGGAVASGSEFLPYHISPDFQAFQQQQQQLQNPITAESNVVAAVEAANNATQPLVPQIGGGLAKIKRQDLSDLGIYARPLGDE